ncbi:MAG: transporter [Roseobacter sp.]
MIILTSLSPLMAQELDPRRWSHLPINTNFFGGAYAHLKGDISFDPALLIEGAKVDIDIAALAYIRTFKLFDRSARVDVVQGWRDARWTGKVNGVDTSVSRQGLTDTRLRFSMNVIGAPPLSGKEYAAYRKITETETIVGVALGIDLPTGHYKKDKLLNIGNNRFTFSPQLGFVHKRGRWTFEGTGTVDFYTDNSSFFGGNKREEDPFFTAQGHIIYDISRGFWVSASLGYGNGGESTINGEEKNDRKEFIAWALSAGYPVTQRLSLKAAYIGTSRQRDFGMQSDTFTVGFSTFW